MPTVSIILPTYNRLPLLEEAVASVVGQTYRDWELIVVDDGSTDGTAAWLESLHDTRVKIVALGHTGEPAALRNRGLSQALAPWVAFQDSDDRWRLDKLERQLAFHADHPTLRWSYTAVALIDADGRASTDTRRKQWVPHRGDIVAALLELDAMIGLPSVIVARSLLDEVGGFDESRHWVEDQDLWLRLAVRAECGLIDEPLIDIRAHESMTYDRPERDLGFMAMYREFARRTDNPEFRATARRRETMHAVSAADRLSRRAQWTEAFSILVTALRLAPLAPFVHRAVAQALGRRLQSVVRKAGRG